MFYLVVLNLSRHIGFRRENVIICGIIPRFSHEPPINTFVAPVVEELKKAWNEDFECYSLISKEKMEWFYLSLICVGCDIPASRKLCGFLGKKKIFISEVLW